MSRAKRKRCAERGHNPCFCGKRSRKQAVIRKAAPAPNSPLARGWPLLNQRTIYVDADTPASDIARLQQLGYVEVLR